MDGWMVLLAMLIEEKADVDDVCMSPSFHPQPTHLLLLFSHRYNHLTTLGAAAHHTTAACASFTVYLLAKHPSVQQKLKAEIKRVMGGRTEMTPEVCGEGGVGGGGWVGG